jgi:trigger factor
MQIQELAADGLKREYKIVVPASQLKGQVDERLQELGRQVRMPGFRPGKVPMPVLKQRYEKSVMGEVLEQAVQHGSQQLMTERNLRPAGQPKIEIVKFEDGQDLEFSVAMEVIPEIKPVDFSTLSLERSVVEIPDLEVEENLKTLANASAAGSGSRRCRVRARQCGRDRFRGPGWWRGVRRRQGAKTSHLELGSRSFIPGFEDQLVDKRKGDKVLVKVAFPTEYSNKELAGKDAEFDVTVKEIKLLTDVALDDAMAKAIGFEDLAALRKAAREQVERDYASAGRARLKRKLLDALADTHDFVLPQGLVDAEFSVIWRQVEADMKAGRLEEEDKGKSEEQLRNEYRDIAVRRVKLGLLLSEVGRLNDIQVPNEDITRAMVNEARRYPGQEKKVIDFYQRSPEALNQLRAPIYEDKVVDHILGRKLSERRISAEGSARKASLI